MRILVSWLRDFVTFDASVEDLADVLTMRGFEVSAVEPAPPAVQSDDPDAVLDLEITTNRPDCLNVLGIAREVSTIYDTDLTSPVVDIGATQGDGESAVSVSVEAADLCPRYVASVADVTVGPSPGWLAARLEAAGVRPINNIVDITNYVMIELGHPMHAFDLDRLGGRILRIRRARVDERVRTLDGQEHRLQPEILVIADSEHPQAVAGVMGGSDSEVSGQTRVAVFESAYFKPTSVRSTSKRLALSTDASYRFERGADIQSPIIAMQRALTLLSQTGAGRLRGPIVDEYPNPRAATTVRLRHARITRILGVELEPAFVPRTLERLGFDVTTLSADDTDARDHRTNGTSWQVIVPTNRVDVSREIDLVEEVARHYGYDRLPTTFSPLVTAPARRAPWQRRHTVLRHVLTASGCSEAITYSFVERAASVPFVADEDDIVALTNPLSEKYAVLRPSLLPGLLDSLIRNRRRGHLDVRFFEIGRRFHQRDGETGGVAIAITGTGSPEHWSASRREVDLFDIKGIVERTCDALGIGALFEPVSHDVLVPGRAAGVMARLPEPSHEMVHLGHLGQLVPSVATARGFPAAGGAVYVAELDMAALAAVAIDRDRRTAVPVPRYPSIVRDLALVVDATLPAAAVRGTIHTVAPETLVGVREFDRYEGKGVPDGCVSLALRLTFRASDRTLTDTEVQASVDTVVTALEQQHGAKLR